MTSALIVGTVCGLSILPLKMLQKYFVSRKMTSRAAYIYGVLQMSLLYGLIILTLIVLWGLSSLDISIISIGFLAAVLLGIGLGSETINLIEIKEIEEDAN